MLKQQYNIAICEKCDIMKKESKCENGKRGNHMANYIDNVNLYITKMKIKQTFVSFKSGINTSTLSRILNGSREVNLSEMEKIAKALGKKVEFFLDENFSVPELPTAASENIVFYVGEPSKEQEKVAMQLLELLENVDEVLSSKGRYTNTIGE